MNPDQIKSVVDSTMSQYLWWFLGAAAALWAKEIIENVVLSVMFILNHDYNLDDEVLIGGTRKARIVRRTLTKTVLYVYDNGSTLSIPNRDFYSLRCERILPGKRTD